MEGQEDPAEQPGSRQALRRVTGAAGGSQVLEALGGRLSGADLTTLLLEAFRRRADRLGPADVLRRYRSDRFVAPAAVGFAALRRTEDAMLGALPDDFEALVLAPVLPLGAHTATGDVDPRNVIATIRGTEVAADPTNGLALEGAVRRAALLSESPRSAEPVRLAASQRVTRAQVFAGPISFAHFQLFGMVTAGRDTGSRSFERQHLAEHLRFAAHALGALGLPQVTIAITCLDESGQQVLAAIRSALAASPGTEVTEAPERASGRAYYRGLCFKVFVGSGAERIEVGDGGFVDWTARLLASKKERLLISGYGIDRLAIMSDA
jgi:hypothetical protein